MDTEIAKIRKCYNAGFGRYPIDITVKTKNGNILEQNDYYYNHLNLPTYVTEILFSQLVYHIKIF